MVDIDDINLKSKRKKQSRDHDTDTLPSDDHGTKKKSSKKNISASNLPIDPSLFDVPFPIEFENAFAAAIFELGLKHSSPKVIIPLMPNESTLNKEHIKSHLQKYRIHHQRSREEFLDYYKNFLQNQFHDWESTRGGSITKNIFSNVKFNTTSCNSIPSIKQESNHFKLSLDNLTNFDQSLPKKNSFSNNQDYEDNLKIDSSIEVLQQSEQLLDEWEKLCQESITKGELFTNDLKNNTLSPHHGRFKDIIKIISSDADIETQIKGIEQLSSSSHKNLKLKKNY